MRHFCTCFDLAGLSRGLALHTSLLAHADSFELTVLCPDEATETALRQKGLPRVRLLALSELTGKYPALAAARSDRSPEEFHRTCKPWLLDRLLASIPTGELLTCLGPSVYFFRSPETVFAGIGSASVAIAPQRFPAGLAHLERYGRFNAGWVTLRHDATGLACARDWAESCAAWCFTIPATNRYAEQKYLDAWPEKFPGTVILAHPGVNVAPWNVGGRVITGAPTGPMIDGQPVISYHFQGLTHLARQLYDPGLHAYDVTPSAELRGLVYRPYLQQLARSAATPSNSEPDIVPPARADDPRAGEALPQLLGELRAAERAGAAGQLALEKSRAAARQSMEAARADAASAVRYIQELERERDAQRKSLLEQAQKLKTAYADLERNVIYLKRLQDEVAAHIEVSIVRDNHITALNEKLTRQANGTAPGQPEPAQSVAEPYLRQIRKLLVVKYHPKLLPQILALSGAGIIVEVLGSPAEMPPASKGAAHFCTENLWDWLGRINSLFNEEVYLHANPDVAAAVAQGAIRSAWEHYLMFGQQDGRKLGVTDYCSGLAEVDAIAFDSSDHAGLVPCLMGRMQPHLKLIISSYFSSPSHWLPPDTSRTTLQDDVLLCHRPPQSWLGPRQPSHTVARGAPHLTLEEVYPPLPAQRAEWPKISVITVVHPQSVNLEATLRSVLDQNYPHLEYLVVATDSVTASSEIIGKYAAQLTLRAASAKLTAGEALNQGLQAATGRVLAWVNPGDRLAPGALFTVGQTFLLHATDLVAGRCAQFVAGHLLPDDLHRAPLPLGHIGPLPVNALLDPTPAWPSGRFFVQPEVFFTREIFNRAGGQIRTDLAFNADYDLWIRLARAGARIFALPEVLALAKSADAAGSDREKSPAQTEWHAVNAAHRATISPAA